jgi:hypothetical protein
MPLILVQYQGSNPLLPTLEAIIQSWRKIRRCWDFLGNLSGLVSSRSKPRLIVIEGIYYTLFTSL